MTPEERLKIISNEYANLIVEYKRFDRGLDPFRNDTLNIIDERFGVIYFPVARISNRIVNEGGYSVIPKLFGLLDTLNLEAMGVTRVQSQPILGLLGQGVLLGFVDTGIDYTHSAFKNEDNTTRIVSIWDQSIENMEASEDIFYFGTEYSREQINQALASEDPFSVVPSRDENGHGTMLAGIAGGSENAENDFQGVVPLAEFAIVKLKQAKDNLRDYFFIPKGVDCFQEDDIMFGINYLFNLSRKLKRPIAICIGVGSNQGGHDGTGAINTSIGWIGSNIGCGIVIAAGNEGNSKHHYYGAVDRTVGYNTVELQVGENEMGFTMELWGRAPATYSIDLLSPSGEYIPQITARLGENRLIRFLFEDTTVRIDYLLLEAQSGDPLILIRFLNPAAGIWRFRVYARGSENLDFHIWLPMNNFISEGTFFVQSNPDTTITMPGNALTGITVTAYNAINQSIYINSSRGYTRNNMVKPDVAAPGVDVLAPVPGNLYSRFSGTSVAAANTSGLAAMILEWGIVRGNYYSISSLQIQRFLIRGVERDPKNQYPNNIWGYGTVNIYNTFLSLRSEVE